jgi:21S rRNA (GM2251-2'-O)-methyltransferase
MSKLTHRLGRNAVNEFIYGKNVVLSALESNKRRILKLYVKESDRTRLPLELKGIELAKEMARNRAIPISEVHKSKLDNYCDNHVHQGLVLQASVLRCSRITHLGCFDYENQSYPLNYSAKEFDVVPQTSTNEHPFWLGMDYISVRLALDRVVDVNNLGAILRTCFFFGVNGVVV